MELPKLDATAVLIDMDDTISYAKPGGAGGGGRQFLKELTLLVAEQDGVSEEEALGRIDAVGDTETVCLFSFLPDLGVSPEVYWKRMQEVLRDTVAVYEDAIVLLRFLRERGIKVYSATTNSKAAMLAKLAVADLATMEGSPYFTGFFGGDAFGDPLGKFSPDYFPSILNAAQFDRESTLMIGDSPLQDLAPALAAGIRHVVLVDRSQEEPLVEGENGGLFVNSLEWVVKMIQC